MEDWASLPSDLVNRVADLLLASNDLDYYMDFRAVCSNWRSATADPKSSPEEPQFRPNRWVMIDEFQPYKSGGDTRLFVNLTTGRFLRKRLPLLRRYYFVTTTSGGSIILAEREAPHTARVLNPFTGSLTHFRAPMPRGWNYFAAAVVGPADSSFTLVLASDISRKVYWADLESEHFLFQIFDRPAGLLPYIAGKYVGFKNGSVVGDTDEVHYDQVRSCEMEHRMLAVDAAGGEVFMVTIGKGSHRIKVLKSKKKAQDASEFQLVTSIGNHALFVGDRSLLVDADKLPSIEPNCIYYQVDNPDGFFSDDIYMYDLNHGKAEKIAEIGGFNPVFRLNDHCFTLIELLVSYTMNVPDYELMTEQLEQLQLSKMNLGTEWLESLEYDNEDNFAD